MCENNRNSVLLGDPAWQISPKEVWENYKHVREKSSVCICSQCYQILTQYIINNRCLKIEVLKINI